jgi:glycosyltransferase involved in cell wall biosynthesis
VIPAPSQTLHQKYSSFVHSLDVGGIETYLLRFLRYAGSAIDSTVLCKSGRGGALMADYKVAGAQVVLLKLGTSLSHRYVSLFRILRAVKWDATCDFTGDFSGLVLLTARLASVKKRLTFYRESQYQFRPTPLRIGFARFLSRLVRSSATRALSNSQSALDRFQPGWKDQGDRYCIIRNPCPDPPPLTTDKRAELRRVAGIPESAFILVHVGRVTPAKNHAVILAVVQAVLERHPEAWAVLIGRGAGEYCYSRLPQSIAGRLKTFEHRSDVLAFLQASDVFLFPSLNEGMPNALIEAMAAGCPVVASDISPIKEVFPPAYNSYLFAPADVAGAVERIERLIEHPDQDYRFHLMNWVQAHFAVDKTFGAFMRELV